jgi:alpha-ketoglutarate-dependent taurine dioxygenase
VKNLSGAAEFAWDRDSLDPTMPRIALSTDASREVLANRHLLSNHSIDTAADLSSRLPALASCVRAIRERWLDGPPGFCVIDAASIPSLSNEERKGLFLTIASLNGELLEQNAAGEKLVEVFDRGRSLGSGARYHQTNASGVLHSDSPQWPDVPDYVALLCVRSALEGGESTFISAYSVLRRLDESRPGLVEALRADFMFDKRGDFRDGEPPVTVAPIARTVDGRLHFRYLRSYIDSGHRLMGAPLSPGPVEALDALDEVLAREDLVVTLKMEPGDIQLLNNHFVLHDRWPFEDHDEPEKRRLMLRAWLRRR